MSRSGADDDRELAKAATVQSSKDGSLDETLPSNEFERPSGRGEETIPSGPHPPAEPVFERGAVIGRYVVLGRIGSGTMGLVLSAIDPTLDRKVAIKLVKADRTGSTSGRQRLLREAQAMARLAHPNVVTVYEVGTYGERVFLAMEYSAGTTLAVWLAHGERTTREILDAFLAAGHGLAAAHRAGIVHRDFKPANVLVASDGRVRVADFGLATAPTTRASSSPPEAVAPLREELSMTSTGAILGTPRYMSPEQHRGNVADARADQFSFCVALYEALYRQLPFDGEAYEVYAGNAMSGRIREAPRGAHVPAWIRKIVMRGLAVDPAQRYPSMDELLHELERDPAAIRMRVGVVALGVALVAGVSVALVSSRSEPSDPCASAERPLAELWTAQAHAAMQQAFVASHAPGADATFPRVARVLDDRVHALHEARRDACMATAVRHEQSDELLDKRMQCIDRRATETETLIAVLSEHPDEAAIGKAVEAAVGLPAVAQCADRNELLAAMPPPSLPGARAQLDKLEHDLSRAEALDAAGKYPQAQALLKQLLVDADKLDYAPMRARVHFADARLHSDLGENEAAAAGLKLTCELAAAAHDDTLLAQATALLYMTLGYRLAHIDQAKALDASLAATVVRAGNTPELRGDLDAARGTIELTAGDYPASAAHFMSAAKLHEQAFGADSTRVANALGNAGIALESAGRYEEARKVIDRALAIRVEMLGADHPTVSYSHYQLGSLLDTMERPKQALEEFQKALAIDAKLYAADSPHLATDYISLGVLLVELDRAKDALDYQQKAVAILEQHPADNEAKMGIALMDLANTHRTLKQYKEAIATYDRSLAVTIKTLGPDHAQVSDILNNEALAVLYSGDHKRARELWQHALAIREKQLGPDHPDVAKALGPLAEEAFDRGAYRETVPLLTRAISILDKIKGPTLPLVFEMVDMRGQAQLALHQYAVAAADLTRARDGYLRDKLATEAATARLALADALWRQGKHGDALAEAHAAADEGKVAAKAKAWLATHH